jgi:SAM-dependent methyltransferase
LENLFTDIAFNSSTLDRYFVRTSISKSLTKMAPNFTGKLLDAGCGEMPYKSTILNNFKVTEYIGLDIEGALDYNTNVKPDVVWDGISMPFDANTFDTVLATEVLEHCPHPLIYLSEACRVLKPSGKLIFTVPFLWTLHEVPHDEHRYTPFALKRMFEEAGFRSSSILPLGGYDASLAVMLGLWINRHRGNLIKDRLLRRLLMPVIKKLINIDRPSTQYNEGSMYTGFYGFAQK